MKKLIFIVLLSFSCYAATTFTAFADLKTSVTDNTIKDAILDFALNQDVANFLEGKTLENVKFGEKFTTKSEIILTKITFKGTITLIEPENFGNIKFDTVTVDSNATLKDSNNALCTISGGSLIN
jgi:hypothetical protein